MCRILERETNSVSSPGHLSIGTTALLMGASMLALSGCAVGPNFEKPAPPAVSGYTQQPLGTTDSANTPGGDAQRFDIGKDISGDWWTVFHSRPLNDLVEEALKNNSDLKAAQAALKSSRESVLAQRGAFLPSVSAGFNATREQDPPGALAPVPSNNSFLYNLYTPQVSVSYSPDVWGLNRRTAESLIAQAVLVIALVAAVLWVVLRPREAPVPAPAPATASRASAATEPMTVIDEIDGDLPRHELVRSLERMGADLAALRAEVERMRETVRKQETLQQN